MHARALPASFRGFLLAIATLLMLGLAGCASMQQREPVRLNVVGLQPLAGQGLEMRFNLQVRVQNPNDFSIDYDGIALELELNGKPFATGLSDQKGSVPRFGDTVISIPISVSALAAARQLLGVLGGAVDNIPYVLRGKISGGPLGATTFSEQGMLNLPLSGKVEIKAEK